MSKQNQRSKNLFKPRNTLHSNNLLLLGLIACVLSILLVTEKASAKELSVNLTESLDITSNDKKPKDLDQKAKLPEKAKSDKTKQIKSEKSKAKPTTVKTKPATSTKTKHDTVKNSINNVR